jgi:hypothetical protein
MLWKTVIVVKARSFVGAVARPVEEMTSVGPPDRQPDEKFPTVARACRAAGVGAVVFVNPLTDHQRAVLGDLFGCTVLSGAELVGPAR